MNDFRKNGIISFFSGKYPCNIASLHKEICSLLTYDEKL